MLSVVTDANQYPFISTLVTDQLPWVTIQFIHPLDLVRLLPDQFYWLLDLDVMSEEQLDVYFENCSSSALGIGLSKQPEHFEYLMKNKNLSTILHSPYDFKDLVPNSWMSSTFLVALKQILLKNGFPPNREVCCLEGGTNQRIVSILDFRK